MGGGDRSRWVTVGKGIGWPPWEFVGALLAPKGVLERQSTVLDSSASRTGPNPCPANSNNSRYFNDRPAQHSTVQHNTAQHSTPTRHSTPQHSTATRHSTAQHSTAQHRAVASHTQHMCPPDWSPRVELSLTAIFCRQFCFRCAVTITCCFRLRAHGTNYGILLSALGTDTMGIQTVVETARTPYSFGYSAYVYATDKTVQRALAHAQGVAATRNHALPTVAIVLSFEFSTHNQTASVFCFHPQLVRDNSLERISPPKQATRACAHTDTGGGGNATRVKAMQQPDGARRSRFAGTTNATAVGTHAYGALTARRGRTTGAPRGKGN